MEEYKHKNVLLIDDSYIDNLINSKIIRNNNFAENTTVIDAPEEALIYLKERISENVGVPEIIFLDLRMPGMSGFDFLRELNALKNTHSSSSEIYVLSSSLDPNDLRKVEENKLVTKFIGKPLTNETLEQL